ncbi:MAG: thiamine pyrophosphate-dependent enzyme, partial [Spirochaetota bacterium]
PAAIAAKICKPEKKVACVTGDGGFLMMAGEMAVARRKKLPVVFIIFADRKLELIRLKQNKKDFASYGTDLDEPECPTPNYVFGVPVVSASNADEYRAALKTAFATDGPVIIEAKIMPGDYDEVILKKHK